MQSISSVVEAPERKKELTATSTLEVSVAPTATPINTMEQHLSMNKQQSHQQPQQQHPTKYNDMNDGCNDNDSATTMGGDDDEGSVVLLNDNDGGDEGGRGGELKCKSSTISNNGSANITNTPSLPHKSGKLKQSLQQQQHSPKAPLSLSPATQTLDRLANFGSQQGGAKLCIHLLANAAAERIGEGNKGRTSDGSVGGEGGRDSNDLQKNGESGVQTDTAQIYDEDEGSPQKCPPPNQSINSKASAINASTHTCEIQAVSADLKKRQCLHDLKEYFMATNNSSEYARSNPNAHSQLPLVPFCHVCINPTLANQHLPHHGLCPKHADFYDSGSYEILNLIVDGNEIGCEACVYQFDMGRRNKSLEHDVRCERSGGGKKKSEKGSTSLVAAARKNSNDATSSDDNPRRLSLKEAAEAGCRKCQKEFRTGRKDHRVHDPSCSRKRRQTNVVEKKKTGATDLGHRDPTKSSRSTMSRELQSFQHSDEEMVAREFGTHEEPAIGGSGVDELSQSTVVEPKFQVGTVVSVEPRSWPGMNSSGGVARVTKVHPSLAAIDGGSAGSCTKYDVAYVVYRKKEKGIEERYVSFHSDYVSPSKDNSGLQSDDEELEEVDDGKKLSAVSSPVGAWRNGSINANNNNNSNTSAENGVTTLKNTDITTSPPLSDYERLRLRNIERNEARLAQLGLLVPPSSKAKSTSSTKGTSGSYSTLTTLFSQGKQKRSTPGTKDTAQLIGTRNQPRRNAKDGHQEESQEPLSTLEKELCSNNQKNLFSSTGNESKNSKKNKRASEKQQTSDNTSKTKQPSNISLPSSVLGASLIQAAKSGCKKCTLEWQTDVVDPSNDHDQCCPRNGNGVHSQKSKQNGKRSSSEANLKSAGTSSSGAIQFTPPPNATTSKAHTSLRSITPSPALQASASPPPLPSFIAEFTSQAVQSVDVPTPRGGAKWLSCPNPWGKIGHEEGDTVIISPFQSESADELLSLFHQGPTGGMPKRFVANPLEEGSPYHATHRSPARGGYSVLRFTRDRMGMRPWGLTVRNHEFGGACLVDSIEPLSPAENAVRDEHFVALSNEYIPVV